MLTKPQSCTGCSLYEKGIGFGTLSGSKNADILFVGETLGFEKGPEGNILNKALRYVGIDKDDVAIHNIVNCKPPGNWLEKAPWEKSSISHCSQYIDKTLEEGNYKVIIAIGTIAAKQLLGLYGKKGVSIYDLHGAPARDKTDKYWVVPTFSTNYILQGHGNLFGVLAFDLARSLEIARDGFNGDYPKLVIDPGYAKFDIWVDIVIQQAEATENGLWLAVDIETPSKHKKQEEDASVGFNKLDSIHRVNFSCDENIAYTVPFDQQHQEGIKKLLAHPKLKKAFWNMNFDKPNLEAADVPVLEPCYDMMYGFHLLQSDIRMGLGFVAPFYSTYGPWKHLTDHAIPLESLQGAAIDNYKLYSAVDGIQTIRCTNGIERDLRNANLWDIFERHVRDIDRFALRPAENIGLLFDKKKLTVFRDILEKEENKLGFICTKYAPQSIVPWEHIWKTPRPAMNEIGELLPGCFELTEVTMCYVCTNCLSINVTKQHVNTKKCKDAILKFEEHKITQWVKEGAFNPNSPKQVLSYIKSQGHKPGKKKKKQATDSDGETSDVSTLESLQRKYPKNLMYPALLKMRKITKMKGTYCDGILKRLDENNRVHSSYTHIPSTLRLSSKDPNLTNLVSKDKKEDADAYGKQFRECVVASKGCVLLEPDFGGVEAVQTGWFAKDPDYIRLAKLSVHSYLTSHVVGQPADLKWSDEDLLKYFKEIKSKYFLEYNKSKRVVHGSSYRLSAMGLHLTYPELFPTLKSAREIQDIFFSVAAGVHDWQNATIKKADKQGYLGGTDHPFHYKHWYYDVIIYNKITEEAAKRLLFLGKQVLQSKDGTWYKVGYGRDANRCVAFYPQSTAGAVLKEAMLDLFDPDSADFIGDTYYGETPLRAPIHDSLLLEVPKNKLDFVAERVHRVMSKPITQQPMNPSWNMGEFLTIGVDMEVGSDWAKMEKFKI